MDTGEPLASAFRQELGRRAKQTYQHAYLCQMQGATEEAIELYRQSLDFLPTPEAYTFLGWALSFQGRYDEAIAACEQAIALDPDFGNPHNDIGAYLIEQGRWEDALPHLQRALQAERYECYHYAHFNLGRIYEEAGDLEGARRHYAEALRLAPGYQLASQALRQIESRFNA